MNQSINDFEDHRSFLKLVLCNDQEFKIVIERKDCFLDFQ